MFVLLKCFVLLTAAAQSVTLVYGRPPNVGSAKKSLPDTNGFEIENGSLSPKQKMSEKNLPLYMNDVLGEDCGQPTDPNERFPDAQIKLIKSINQLGSKEYNLGSFSPTVSTNFSLKKALFNDTEYNYTNDAGKNSNPVLHNQFQEFTNVIVPKARANSCPGRIMENQISNTLDSPTCQLTIDNDIEIYENESFMAPRTKKYNFIDSSGDSSGDSFDNERPDYDENWICNAASQYSSDE